VTASDTTYLIVGIVSAALLFGGAWVTARSSRKATDNSTAVEGFDKLTGRLESRLTEVETRLQVVEAELRGVNRLLRSALGYIERLLDFIAATIPARPETPPIPADLHDHLPPSLVESWRNPPPPVKPQE
jgi:hypothetical protein